MNVYQKLNKIQVELNAPKNQRNNFGNYNYRSCEDILEALKPLLKEVGGIVTISDSIIHIEGRFYIQATAKFIDIEKGDVIENTALAREEENKKGMDSSQITGSTSSYARKYALNGLFCIDDNKDSDHTNTHGKDNKTNTTTPPPGPGPGPGPTTYAEVDGQNLISERQQKMIYAKSKAANLSTEEMKKLLKKHGFNSSKEITKDKLDDIIKAIG